MKKLLLILAAVTMVFVACKKENKDDNAAVTTDLNLSETIIGKWVTADEDGQSVLTNSKKAITFVSTTQAYISAAFNTNPEIGAHWLNKMEVAVAIEGNKVTVTSHPDEHTTTVEELTVTAISGSEFSANRKLTATVDGNIVDTKNEIVRYVKVTADFSEDIIGMWECMEITGGQTNNDDNARLEFLADVSYNFYRKDESNVWNLVPRELNEFFVDGKFLATRWKDIDEEMAYEWWEISSINGDDMQWTALRQNEDGTTFQQGVKWQKVTPQTVLAGMDATGVTLYDNVAYSYTYDADHRLTHIYEVTTTGDNYVVRDINLAYSAGHLSISGMSEGYNLTAECTLNEQGRITEMTRSAVSITTGFTSNRTFIYTYDADGHMATMTQITDNAELTHTFVWENGELVSVFTGEGTGNGDMVLAFETSDAPAQALFYLMKYDSDVSEICLQGFFGTLPAHMPSTRSLTIYMNGTPIHTTTSEYVYTVENGRLATCQDNDGISYSFRWGIMKK